MKSAIYLLAGIAICAGRIAMWFFVPESGIDHFTNNNLALVASFAAIAASFVYDD